ncbi:MAG: hypothetical protein ABFS18_11140 [Thermodesulfobacteriota bacterium]
MATVIWGIMDITVVLLSGISVVQARIMKRVTAAAVSAVPVIAAAAQAVANNGHL